jgi:hypothetical protein
MGNPHMNLSWHSSKGRLVAHFFRDEFWYERVVFIKIACLAGTIQLVSSIVSLVAKFDCFLHQNYSKMFCRKKKMGI